MSAQSISLDELIYEAMDLAARLDALSTRDHRQTTMATLQEAEEKYAALLAGRDSLPTSVRGTAELDDLLDNLRARLKFFARRR